MSNFKILSVTTFKKKKNKITFLFFWPEYKIIFLIVTSKQVNYLSFFSFSLTQNTGRQKPRCFLSPWQFGVLALFTFSSYLISALRYFLPTTFPTRTFPLSVWPNLHNTFVPNCKKLSFTKVKTRLLLKKYPITLKITCFFT